MIAAGFVAFTLTAGGGAIAGSLVTSAQIQDDTIRSADVKDGTLKLRDIAEAARANLGARTVLTELTSQPDRQDRRDRWD
jgi:hypothetical protein